MTQKKKKEKKEKKKEKHAWDKTRIKEGYYTWWREKHLPFVIKIRALAWRISRKLEIKSGIAYSNQHIVPKRRRNKRRDLIPLFDLWKKEIVGICSPKACFYSDHFVMRHYTSMSRRSLNWRKRAWPAWRVLIFQSKYDIRKCLYISWLHPWCLSSNGWIRLDVLER